MAARPAPRQPVGVIAAHGAGAAPGAPQHGACPSRRGLIALLGAWPLAAAAAGPPSEVLAGVAGARLHGQARFTYFGLHVYDIRLWTGETFRIESPMDPPLALELEYARRLSGNAIAERSLQEMRRGSGIDADQAARWLDAMRRIFPDVAAGDRLTGVHRSGAGLRFFLGGKVLGDIEGSAFARAFLGIWLAPTSSEPVLRAALLGLAR